MRSDGNDGESHSKLNVRLVNEEHDTPDAAPSYGSGGWTKDGKYALIYDHFDIWAVVSDAATARKLTDGRAGIAVPSGAARPHR